MKNVLKKLFWWHFAPADEREQALFYTAYRKTWLTFQFLLSALLVYVVVVEQAFIKTPEETILVLLIGVLIAMTTSSSVFWNEEVSFRRNTYTKINTVLLVSTLVVVILLGVAFLGGALWDCGTTC